MVESTLQLVASTALITPSSAVALDGLAAAWLHEKTNRSGSASTRRAYFTFLVDFRAALAEHGCDLASDPHRVALVAQAWEAREVVDKDGALQAPSAAYHNQRLAALASFYEYAIRRRAGWRSHRCGHAPSHSGDI